MKQKTIAILGATGSIGTQALDLVRRYPDRFSAVCLTAHSSGEKLFQLVREFRPQVVGMVCEPKEIPDDLKFCQWFFGADCSVKALEAAKPHALRYGAWTFFEHPGSLGRDVCTHKRGALYLTGRN